MSQIMKYAATYGLLIIVLLGCEAGNSEKKEINNAKLTTKMQENENSNCLTHQKLFLQWYLANYERLDSSRRIVKYPQSLLDNGDVNILNTTDGKYYKFDSVNLDNYLVSLKNTGYFSDHYITAKRVDMMARGKKLDQAKQEDGPPEGFDFDEVFHTQEMYLDTNIHELRVDSVSENKYILPINDEFRWIIYTKKIGNTCLIDSISSE